jgi:hypothetical protein
VGQLVGVEPGYVAVQRHPPLLDRTPSELSEDAGKV